MLDLKVIQRQKIWFSASGLFIALSLVFVTISIFKYGAPVKPGLDFTGGSKIELEFTHVQNNTEEDEALTKPEEKVMLSSEAIQNDLKAIGLSDSRIQISTGDDADLLILKTKVISDDLILDTALETIKEKYGNYKLTAIDSVSSIIGPELFTSGLTALIVTVLAIILYISSRFKREYALAAIVALCHDVLITLGLFAFLGIFYNIEVQSLFITALLSIFGFSVHDTIVVFDRIRENQKLLSAQTNWDQIIEKSINQVFTRSLNTSITTLAVLGSLFLFGGSTTKLFVGALFVGLLAGTYSSIFVASPILLTFRNIFDK